MRWLGIFTVLMLSGTLAASSYDDRFAYQLFQEGRYAEAGEVFLDPAWKGVAFYKSDQWWRAADAFARAKSPESMFNLGNTYVRTGYLELALESYLVVQQIAPGHSQAEYNANIVRELLSRESQEGKGKRQQRARKIDRVESDQSGGGEEGNDDQQGNESGQGEGGQQDDQRQGNQVADGGGGEGEGTEDMQTGAGNPGQGEQLQDDKQQMASRDPSEDNAQKDNSSEDSGRRIELKQQQDQL